MLQQVVCQVVTGFGKKEIKLCQSRGIDEMFWTVPEVVAGSQVACMFQHPVAGRKPSGLTFSRSKSNCTEAHSYARAQRGAEANCVEVVPYEAACGRP